MPILPPSVTAPFPTATQVLNRARAITNDAAQTIAGNLLADAQPYTIEDLNKAYEDLQYELANHGYEDCIFDSVISGIPACAASVQTDPGIQLWMSYTNFFDGSSTTSTPVLPNDLMIPLRMWERQTGSVQNFVEMRPVDDGLPSVSRGSFLRYWDWINNKLYFVGALQIQDVRMRYVRRLPVLASGSDQIQIPDSKNALANLVAATFAKSRGSLLADSFKADADVDIHRIVQRTARKKQRGSHRRRPYGSGNKNATQY